jgi:hypothetical protein
MSNLTSFEPNVQRKINHLQNRRHRTFSMRKKQVKGDLFDFSRMIKLPYLLQYSINSLEFIKLLLKRVF